MCRGLMSFRLTLVHRQAARAPAVGTTAVPPGVAGGLPAIEAAVEVNDAQSHYLAHVMRLKVGDHVEVFNGRDGAWLATIGRLGKKTCELLPVEQVRPQTIDSDLWLLFAPLKRQRIDYLVEKATELGVSVLQPIKTRYTVVDRVNLDRLRAHCIEAAEQTGRVTIPELRELTPLEAVIESWDDQRKILFCDESMPGTALGATPHETLLDLRSGPWGVLVGPEGGFHERERQALRGKAFVVPIALGPRVLRADTAAIAALTLWQSHMGDW